MESLSILTNQNWFSINRKSWIRFLKIRSWLIQTSLFKSFQNFFSLSDSARLHNKFFVVFFLISCKVSLSISRYVHITLSFSFIFSFSCIEGLFLDLAYFRVFDDSNLILWNWSLGFCSRMLYIWSLWFNLINFVVFEKLKILGLVINSNWGFCSN